MWFGLSYINAVLLSSRNVQASCHKHFVVRHTFANNKRRRLPAISVTNVPQSGAAFLSVDR